MQGELTIIQADGTTSRKPLANLDHYPELKTAVGGGIALVPGFSSFEGKPCDAYANDEGITNGLPSNRTASELWWRQIDDNRCLGNALTMLHGPLAIVTGDDEFIAASR